MIESSARRGEHSQPLEVDKILDNLWHDIPDIARNLIGTNLDQAMPANQSFLENPDDPKQHKPGWHQWGVITHSQKFGEAYDEQIPDYLEHWGLKDIVDLALSEEIDGVPKAELLRLVAPLHDLGKFTRRQLKRDVRGKIVGQNFLGHEVASGEIIRGREFNQRLESYGLTPAQIEYLARCSELHFELGVIRKRTKNSKAGYSLEFVNSSDFDSAALDLMYGFPDMKLEIGLLFLADNLAKTKIRIGADTDEQINSQRHLIYQALAEASLDSRLADAVAQLPVNLAAARRYLKLWAKNSVSSTKNRDEP